jgi:futalosine hydrolase
MKILLLAATNIEIQGIQNILSPTHPKHTIDFLISDIGMMATTFHLYAALHKKQYDLVIQIGIAGAFNTNLNIGDVVEVVSDTYGDLGVEDKTQFTSIFDMQLMQQDKLLFEDKKICNPHQFTNLTKATGITVNTGSGHTPHIERLKLHFNVDVESMEGLALAYVCTQLQIPYIQLRGISNYVTERDTTAWNIPLALNNLNNFVTQFILTL